MATKKKMLQAAASSAGGGGGGFTAIEDVFSTYLYTGNDSTQTITNGIDLAGEGGLVWLKDRKNTAGHYLFTGEDGIQNIRLFSDTTGAAQTAGTSLIFDSSGFTVGPANANANNFANGSNRNFASWTFRKAPRFFDVVTYTGDGVAGRTIAHNLGVQPGFITIKRLDASGSWYCAAKSGGGYISPNVSTGLDFILNGTGYGDSASAGNVASSTTFNLNMGTTSANNYSVTNINGATYVAYLFAHDPLGPSEDGSDGLIACGSYTGNSSNAPRDIELGWEPQWLLIKNASTSANWYLSDETRGMHSQKSGQGNNLFVLPNSGAVESATGELFPYSRGFTLTSNVEATNAGGDTYIYIAVRRGPMKQPTDASKVFNPVAYTADNSDNRLVDTGFLTDAAILKARDATSVEQPAFASRLTGRGWVISSSSGVELLDGDGLMAPPSNLYNEYPWSSMSGFGVGNDLSARFNYLTNTLIAYGFRRAPGFFDVVAYTGDGVAGRTVPHNLGVAPEMMLVKRRDSTGQWPVYHKVFDGENFILRLNTTAALIGSSAWQETTPTNNFFTISNSAELNASGGTYIAYLFATLAGVSKVGSYTGNGTSQTIDCGFTGGARFILIKRTDGTGDWYVWDTARGIVAGNDPHLSLNSTAAEVTTYDSVDPDSSGFIINQDADININVSAASYIFYAVA